MAKARFGARRSRYASSTAEPDPAQLTAWPFATGIDTPAATWRFRWSAKSSCGAVAAAPKRHGNACIATRRDRVCIEEESAAADAPADVGQLGFDTLSDRSCIPAQPRVGYRVGDVAATPLRPVPWPELSVRDSEFVGLLVAGLLAEQKNAQSADELLRFVRRTRDPRSRNA